jgi:hypothetical protein
MTSGTAFMIIADSLYRRKNIIHAENSVLRKLHNGSCSATARREK